MKLDKPAPKPVSAPKKDVAPNKELLKDYTLQNNYSEDELKYKIEETFDQFDDIFAAMGDIAEQEMFHDYPEIKSLYSELYKYKVSSPSKELVQVLHKLTSGFQIKGRTLEVFSDDDLIHKDFNQIDKELEGLNKKKENNFGKLEDKLKDKPKSEVRRPHPFEIKKPSLRP